MPLFINLVRRSYPYCIVMNRVSLCLGMAGLAAASATPPQNKHDRAFYLVQFHEWLAEHDLNPASGDEFVHMLQNYANNHDIIEAHNSENHSYTLGHNKFSHLSLDEFRAHVRLGLDPPQKHSVGVSLHAAPSDVSALPANIDWRAKGAVSEVKDQGQCGSW